jgi:hypothetical protein
MKEILKTLAGRAMSRAASLTRCAARRVASLTRCAARRVASAAIISVIVSGLALASAPRRASAATTDLLLQAPLIGQQFSQADPSGDLGAYDCLPASLTMAISILDQIPADYASVRQYMRAKSGLRLGGLGQTYGVVEYSTGGRFSADKTYHQAGADGWRALIESELTQGRPLVLYIADASKLDDSSGQVPRPSNESFADAHAVLAVGLVDGGATVVIDDPWNATQDGPGRQLRMTADAFAATWGNTRFSGGTVYSNAGWNYIGFHPTSSTDVSPVAPPAAMSPPAAPAVVGFTGQSWRDWICDSDFHCSAQISLDREATTAASGYRVYGTPYDEDCDMGITQPRGPRTLIATVSGSNTQWAGTLDFDGGAAYSIDLEAFNDAGAATTHAGALTQPAFCQ